MTEQKIQELLKDLFKLKYHTSGSYSYEREVVDKEQRHNVENVIRKALLDNHDSKIGELEAKVFMYEQIIAKSTFASMLPTEHKEEDLTVREAMENITSMFEAVHGQHRFILDAIHVIIGN